MGSPQQGRTTRYPTNYGVASGSYAWAALLFTMRESMTTRISFRRFALARGFPDRAACCYRIVLSSSPGYPVLR